jgi:hypothetical protein
LPSPDARNMDYAARDRLDTYREAYASPRCFKSQIRAAAMPRGFSFRLPSSLKVYDST